MAISIEENAIIKKAACVHMCVKNDVVGLRRMYENHTLRFENFFFDSNWLFDGCAKHDCVESMIFLVEHGMPLGAVVMKILTDHAALKCLRYACDHGQKLPAGAFAIKA